MNLVDYNAVTAVGTRLVDYGGQTMMPTLQATAAPAIHFSANNFTVRVLIPVGEKIFVTFSVFAVLPVKVLNTTQDIMY